MADAKTFVAVTGGHFAPAYCVTKALTARGARVLFFGRTSVFEDRKDVSLEKQALSSLANVRFISLDAPRMTSLRSLPQFIAACFVAVTVFLSNRPTKIISFGGYVSFPVCVVGWLLRIPIYLHEQTISPGKANSTLARFAREIFVSFPEAAHYFPPNKTFCIGNPLRERYEETQKPAWYPDSDKPLLLILGGSSGSHSINMLIRPLISELEKKYAIVHQVGDSSYRDYEELLRYASETYVPIKFILPPELTYLFDKSHMVISRAGANTFFDLVHFQKPSILIPLPWAQFREQELQALELEKKGVSILFTQNKPGHELLSIILAVESNYSHHVTNFAKLQNINQRIIWGEEFLDYLDNTPSCAE